MGTFRHASSAVSDAGKQVVRHVVEFGYRPAPPAVAAGLDLDAEAPALFSRSVRTVDDVPLDLVHEWVPARVAGRLSHDDAEGTGIWASLQRHGHRIASVRQTITAAVTTDDDAGLLDVGARHTAAARTAGRARGRRGPAGAVRPPLPRPPVQPRGRVPRLAHDDH